MADLIENEDVRAAGLLDAQSKAEELFAAIETRGLISPGVTEVQASDSIRDLANEMFGTSRFWHKRIVRAGENTLHPYRENPPDRVLDADDIVFCDFGPIFEEWEADFGRTFVLGDDPAKLKLRDTLPVHRTHVSEGVRLPGRLDLGRRGASVVLDACFALVATTPTCAHRHDRTPDQRQSRTLLWRLIVGFRSSTRSSGWPDHRFQMATGH